MTPEQFFEELAALVGPGRGLLRRGSRAFGFSESTLWGVRRGARPVPAAYVARLREAQERSREAGECYPFVASRLVAVLEAAEAAGFSRHEALAAMTAWAALALSGAAPAPSRRP